MWKPIDLNNLPKEEVLGAEVNPDTSKVSNIGYGYVYVGEGIQPYVYRGLKDVVYITHYFDPRTLAVEKPTKIAGIERLKSLILAAPKQTQLTLAATKGNCFQTCIAAIMNKGIEEVPGDQEMDDARWASKFIDAMNNGWEYHGRVSFQHLDAETWEDFPFLIVGGESPRRTKVGHAVIYFNGAPFWDPHPSGDFILNEKEAYLIRPIGGWDKLW